MSLMLSIGRSIHRSWLRTLRRLQSGEREEGAGTVPATAAMPMPMANMTAMAMMITAAIAITRVMVTEKLRR
jgi:hypothetical protein